MQSMAVLIDTNILLNYITNREDKYRNIFCLIISRTEKINIEMNRLELLSYAL